MNQSNSKSLKIKNEKQDPLVRMNIGLLKSLHKDIKRPALDEDITVNALALKALKEYIDK